MIVIDSNQCIKCNLCVSTCFQATLKREPQGITVNETFECMDCTECIDICPTNAIVVKEEE